MLITSKEIKEKAKRQYKDFLKTIAIYGNSDNFFPLVIRGAQTKATGDLRENQKEIFKLLSESKNTTGKGWSLILETVNTRANGSQTVIKQIEIENQKDYFDVTGLKKEAEYFENSISIIRSKIRDSDIDIEQWILNHIKELSDLENEKQNPNFWNQICDCVNFLRRNKHSNLYIREIPLEVHTKFIEQNKSLIHSLICEEKINETFEEEHGLKSKPNLIRFRNLDKELHIDLCGIKLEELSLQLDDFKNLESFFADYETIFIVENEMVFLTFPEVKKAICIWGHGYAAAVLQKIKWFENFKLIYFGDLDEHGFDILSKFRMIFPNTFSLCMNLKTLKKFEDFRVPSKIEKHIAVGENLTAEEKECLEELNRQQEKNRLEQERIDNQWIKSELHLIQES